MIDDVRELVLKAQAGDEAAFTRLVARNQGRVYWYAVRLLKHRPSAEDAVQETFLRAFLGLKTLGRPEYFVSWLYAICRRAVLTLRRKAARDPALPLERDPPSPTGPAAAGWAEYGDCLDAALLSLDPDDRDVVDLKYYAGLSYDRIALLLNITRALVKSRLHEARRKLKKVLPAFIREIEWSPAKNSRIKERIMKQLELLKKTASAVRQLSLNQQLELCRSVEHGERFPDIVLEEWSRIDEGKEVVSGYRGRMSLSELIDVLGVNRRLEEWIVENLEKRNPSLAEAIKRRMFVFEDIVFADQELTARLAAELGEELVIALSNCPASVKNHVLSAFPPGEREKRLRAWPDQDTDLSRIYEAQGKAVGELRRWEEEGIIEVRGPDNPDPRTGRPALRLRPKE